MPKSAAKRPRKKPVRKSTPKPKAQPTGLLVRTSERTSFEACRWQWHHGYNEKLTPIREAPALKFGTLVHKALELRYPPGIKRGPKPAETFERLFNEERAAVEREWKIRVDDEWMDMLDLGIVLLEAYVEEYGRDEEWKVLASEMTFRVPIYLPADAADIYPLAKGLAKVGAISEDALAGKEPLFIAVGTMDGVWENRMDQGVRINDYKTTSSDPTKEAAGKYSLDEQTTSYWGFGAEYLIHEKGILKAREIRDLDGMLFTWLRKGKPDSRKRNAQGQALNQDGTVSKVQPPPLFHRELIYRAEAERRNAQQRAIEQVLEMIAVRQGILPLHKAPGTGYPQMQCNSCGFRDFCEIHEADGDWELMKKASTTGWEPYGDHEIEDEGKGH